MRLEQRLLLAGSSSTELANALVRAGQATELFSDEGDRAVCSAITFVLRDGRGSVMTPKLVAERLGPQASFLLAASEEEVAESQASFRADLAYLVQRTRAHQLLVLAHEAKQDLSKKGGISDATTKAVRELANAPDPAMLGARRETGFQAIAERQKRHDRLLHFGFRPPDFDAASYRLGGTRFAGGFRTSDLVVIGAESGVGKTTFSLEMTMRALWLFNEENDQHRSALVFSAEQPAEETAMIAGLTRGGRWYEPLAAQGADVHLLDQADYGTASVESVIASVVDIVHSTVAGLRREGRARQEIRARLPLLIVVDYAKLFAPLHMPAVQGIELVAASLKQQVALGAAFDAARYPELDRYGPAVVLPTQVKRQKAMSRADRGDWRPTLDDIADCRAIVDYADCVVLLHREADEATSVVARNDDGDATGAEIRLAKMRRARRSAWYPCHFQAGRWFVDPEEARQGFIASSAPAYLADRRRAQARRAEIAEQRAARDQRAA